MVKKNSAGIHCKKCDKPITRKDWGICAECYVQEVKKYIAKIDELDKKVIKLKEEIKGLTTKGKPAYENN